MSDNVPIRFIDLFSGLGGTRIGLEKACDELGLEHECMLSCDKKHYARTAYEHHFHEKPELDVTKLDETAVPDFDFLLAGFPCFPAGSPVITDKGVKDIADIAAGDMVLTHKGRYRKVLAVGRRMADCTIILSGKDANGAAIKVECTPNHPFFSSDLPQVADGTVPISTLDELWIDASDMPGFPWMLVSPRADGTGAWGKCIARVLKTVPTIVYNMEVEEDNSYTAYGIAVHNCQAFSRAGMRRGFSDTRGTMFFELERIMKEKEPRFALLENVADLERHDKGRTLSVIVEHLEAMGYAVSHKVLNGKDFGLAQSRPRIYICAMRDGDRLNFDQVRPTDSTKRIGDIAEEGLAPLETPFTKAVLSEFPTDVLGGYVISDKRRGPKTMHSWDIGQHGKISKDQKKIMENILSEFRKRKWAEELGVKWRDGMPLNADQLCRITGFAKDRLKPMLEDLVEKGYLIKRHPYCDDSLDEREDLPVGYKLVTSRVSFELNRFLGPEDVCVTLTATDASHIGIIDGKGIRRLSIRECLRLFGFPEDYDLSCVSTEQAYDLVGNSICVPVVSEIAKAMLRQGGVA